MGSDPIYFLRRRQPLRVVPARHALVRALELLHQLAVAQLGVVGDLPAAAQPDAAERAPLEVVVERAADGGGAARRLAVVDDRAVLPQSEHAAGLGRGGDQRRGEWKIWVLDGHGSLPRWFTRIETQCYARSDR